MITGFGRFMNHESNPTKELLGLLPKSIHGHPLIKIELPVIFDECFDVLLEHVNKHKPDAILMLGLAAGRRAITPERVAINLKDASAPDNVGNQPHDTPIIAGAPDAYFSRLPLRRIEQRLQDKNIPVAISNSAGLYVCNNLFYHVMHHLDQVGSNAVAGFIHVPYMDEQDKPADAFSLPLDRILEGIIDAIKCVIE